MENTSNNKQDAVDRKVDGVVKLFGLVERDWRNFALLISILINVYVTYKYIDQNDRMTEIIIEQVDKRSPAIIQEKVEEKTTEILAPPVKQLTDLTDSIKVKAGIQ